MAASLSSSAFYAIITNYVISRRAARIISTGIPNKVMLWEKKTAW